MPKTKKLEDSDSDSSGPTDRTPPVSKKAKTESSSSSSKSKDPEWELDKKRFVKVRDFKGNVYIDIREYYDDGGEMKPGKKGISLSIRQWQKLKSVMGEIDDVLKTY